MPPNQPDLFTAAEERDHALDIVAHGAGDWLPYAVDFIETYARTHQTVFVDDLWSAGLDRPPNAKALGPAMLKAARSKLIAKTGEYRPSTSSHLLPKPVWRSLVYGSRP